MSLVLYKALFTSFFLFVGFARAMVRITTSVRV